MAYKVKYLIFCTITAVTLVSPSILLASQINESGVRVVHIYDGDTISVQIGNIIERVRLLGIDSPELHDPKSGVAQCYAKEALSKVSDLLTNHTVTLKKDTKSKNRDIYGRLLRYVFVNNLDLDSYLIEQGYARVYRSSPILRLKNLEKKEHDARAAHRGLWNTKNCH